jgi:two-component system, OmpR family, sensor histidine kinase MtrB
MVRPQRDESADAPRPAGPSLRWLAIVSASLVGVLALTVLVGLLVSSTRLTHSIRDVERNTRAVALATEIDRSLRDYHRVANLWAAERDQRHDEARRASEEVLLDVVLEASVKSDSVREAQLVADFARDLELYLERRRELEAQIPALDGLVTAVRPSLERALDSAALLRRYQEARLHRGQVAASELNRVVLTIAALSGLLLVGSLFGAVAGVQRQVLAPLSQIRHAMQRFDTGEFESRATEAGTREICEIAITFNDMADTIGRRRQDMLAFLAGVAHDLRTPIAAVKLAWQGLLRTGLPVEPTQLERLDRQLDRLARMVGDLLDAVRIEAGELALEPEDIDLRLSTYEMVEIYRLTSPAHAVRLELPEEPVEVRADPLRLEQVTSNLLSNAIKYSPEGGEVNVRVLVVGKEAELVVSDQGIGIPEEELPNLFMPFRRGVSSKGVSTGAGLGLSVVRRILSAHGGRIDVQSTPGRGSTFRVRLPLAPETTTGAME